MLLILLACNGQGPKVDDSGVLTGPAPQLWYFPDTLSYSPDVLGGSDSKDVTIRNTGGSDLVIRGLATWGSGAFSLATLPPSQPIPPGEIITVSVQFTPTNPNDTGGLTILTNDPLAPSVNIPLEGFALVPSIELSPNPMDFGLVPSGCKLTRTLSVNNVGYAELRIDELVNTNPVFSLPEDLELPLEDPIFVAPGASWELPVTFNSITEVGAEGELWFTGNDILGVNVGILQGQGTTDRDGSDEFWQSDAAHPRTDILVFISRTSSMADNEGLTRANLDALADALVRTPLDWQLGVATKDDGCVNVGVVTPVNFSDGAVLDSAFSGEFGLLTDEGLSVAKNALDKTGEGLCNQGLLRNESKPTIILISDAAEQSAQGWESVVGDIQELAPGVVIHAVSPSASGACETSVLGAGYQEAAEETGGVNLNFCDADWGAAFQHVFDLLYTGPATAFPLSSVPDPNSISVRVNEAATNAWSYNSNDNTVVFESAPAAGAHITIEYDLGASCG